MENVTIRVTRAAARRKRMEDGMETPIKKTETVEVEAADGRRKRRRVVLGDITQEANSGVLDGGGKKKGGLKNVSELVIIDINKKVIEPHDDCNSVGVDPVTLVCPKDASEIDTYLRSMEMRAENRPNADYIQLVQKDVTAGMRGVLVDWLVEVAEEYKLLPNTLFSTVSCIDRFLSCQCINRSKLQLLGVSCMLAASKYEEISPPNTEEFRYITDNTYTKDEVVDMEFDVLKYLKWAMGAPTAKTFLGRFIKECLSESDESYLQFEFLSSYLAELSLIDYACIQYPPSIIAASAVFLARFTLDTNANPWNTTLHLCSNYNPSDLKDCVGTIHDLQLNKKNSSLTAIREKYRQHKFKFVATLVPPPEIPSTYFEDASPDNNNDQSV
ncbi:Cyclin A-like protein [Zostera marina]|uniref:Cyclin A-like protein n=1 Tax=Zostera marina TaxID=29655 RepID=A0A0K9PZY7_ZOSMR|nr:Cyclin A-like protein [Zostera marina]